MGSQARLVSTDGIMSWPLSHSFSVVILPTNIQSNAIEQIIQNIPSMHGKYTAWRA